MSTIVENVTLHKGFAQYIKFVSIFDGLTWEQAADKIAELDGSYFGSSSEGEMCVNYKDIFVTLHLKNGVMCVNDSYEYTLTYDY